MRLDAKAAVITDAGRGLGLAYARALAGAGAGVVVNDLDGEAVERAVKSSIGDVFADGIRPHLEAR
jgi:NAD(P)-dependent dehydrogenase (short-subunit alcohol dehydrogenase family)